MFHVNYLDVQLEILGYLLDIGGGAGKLDCEGACWSSS